MKKVIVTIVCLLLSLSTYAHSGRTDSSGGHYNRTTGDYHYHNGGPAYYNHPKTKKEEITVLERTLIIFFCGLPWTLLLPIGIGYGIIETIKEKRLAKKKEDSSDGDEQP